MHDLAPFVQFKKREKHPWKSVTLSKVDFILFIYLQFVFINLNNRFVIHIILKQSFDTKRLPYVSNGTSTRRHNILKTGT